MALVFLFRDMDSIVPIRYNGAILVQRGKMFFRTEVHAGAKVLKRTNSHGL